MITLVLTCLHFSNYQPCVRARVSCEEMHTFASKVTARDREVVPQYYYRLSENTSWVHKIKIGVRGVLAFLLTEVGVIVLIVCYMLCGALAFHNIEADSWMDVATEAEKVCEQ